MSAQNNALLVVMSDDVVPTTVQVSAPRCGPIPPQIVSPAAPGVFTICPEAAWMDQGLALPPDYAISVRQTPPSGASLKAVFKVNNPADHSDDAFLVFAKSRLGSSYWPIGYRAFETFHRYNSRWATVAEGALTLNYTDCSGSQVSTPMAANDVFQDLCPDNAANEEATGFGIYSSLGEKFALISGADCGVIPGHNFTGGIGCETLLEMMPPAEWAGSEYFVTEFNKFAPPDPPGDIVRILAPSPQQASPVSITVTPAPLGGLSSVDLADAHPCPHHLAFDLLPGEFCDVHVKGGARIAASGKILVGHFALANGQTSTGDSSFVMVAPTSHHVCGHRFYSFSGFDWNATGLGDGTYLNIVSLWDSVESILLDGEPLDSPNTHCHDRVLTDYGIGPTGHYGWVRCRLDNPPAAPAFGEQHVLALPTQSDVPFAAYAYGQRPPGAAYTYATAMGF